jgi:hypothetical protein
MSQGPPPGEVLAEEPAQKGPGARRQPDDQSEGPERSAAEAGISQARSRHPEGDHARRVGTHSLNQATQTTMNKLRARIVMAQPTISSATAIASGGRNPKMSAMRPASAVITAVAIQGLARGFET